MNNITSEEFGLIERIRHLQPYEKIEIKLKDNRVGDVVVTITTNTRVEYAI